MNAPHASSDSATGFAFLRRTAWSIREWIVKAFAWWLLAEAARHLSLLALLMASSDAESTGLIYVSKDELSSGAFLGVFFLGAGLELRLAIRSKLRSKL
jgi:hypothetical protein